jgi:dCMP deaminase
MSNTSMSCKPPSSPSCFGDYQNDLSVFRECWLCAFDKECKSYLPKQQTHPIREPWDNYFMRVAQVVATRSTCRRRQVGCVLVSKENKVLATGFNGVPRGFAHCSDHPCPGAGLPSGQGLDLCLATHAEANALMQCSEVGNVHTCYTTASPCVQCTKLLLNSGATRVVYLEEYPHTQSKDLWLSVASNSWVKVTI